MKLFIRIVALSFLALGSLAGPMYPLKVLPGHHYLVDQNNTPVFIHGDSAWSMIAQLNIADAETYMSNRASLQVNALIVNLIEHKFCANPPLNVYGVGPFTNKINGTYWDFGSVNPDYFTNVDNQIRIAAKYGITVFLDPDFLGVFGGNAGWYADLNNNSSNTLFSFGQYIGNRYSSFANIAWLQGGDYTAANANNLVNAVAQGIATTDTNHIQLAQGFQNPGFTFTGPWNVVNTVYEYHIYNIPSDSGFEFRASPVSPMLLSESNYEGEDNSGMGHLATAHDCRNEAYYSAFSGSSGEFFGNHWIWQFISSWPSQQFTSMSTTLTNLPRLLASRPWYACLPDTSHTAIIAGFGTAGQNTYCPALRHSGGATVMAYIPGNSGSVVTLITDLTKMSGTTANAWWYNPADGSVISIGSYPTTGTQSFTSPDSGEWVLVLDDASQNFGAPGGDSSAPATISSFGASPATIANGGTATLSWTVSGNPAPLVSISPAIGTVTGSSITVSPSATTTYTLTASNRTGITSAQTVVTVTAGPDTSPPSIPTNLTVTSSSASQINLAWSASIDNVGVTGYKIFRNAVLVGTSAGALFSDTGLPASTSYTYTVAAFDAAGNISAQSAPLVGKTQPLVSTPSLTQTGANLNDSAGTTITQPFSSPNNPGNLIVVVTSWGDSVASPTVSDTEGNTYVLATSTYNPAGDQSLAIYYAKNVNGGPNTVTVNFGGSHAWRRIILAEYSGIDPVNPLDRASANQGSASTATDNVTSGSVATSASGDLIFGAVENFNVTGTVSAGTGFTLRNFLMDKGVIETAFEDRIASSAGSTSATFTFSHSDPYIAQMVAFRSSVTGDTIAPSVPTNLTAAGVSTSQINLVWSNSADNAAVAGYQVFRNGLIVGTSPANSYSDTGLAASTTYSYTVAAFDAAGNVSAQSASASATTQAASLAPTISQFSAAPSTINPGANSTLSWTVSGSPAPTLSIAPGIGFVTGASKVVSPIVTTTYTLTASNSAGIATRQTVVTVLDTIAPSVPTNLMATAVSTSQINLVWSNSTDNVGVAVYQVFRNGVALGTSPTNSYSDIGLTASTTYTYTVAASDAAGNVSAQSASATATTQAPSIAPTISQFSASPSTINPGANSTLSWTVSGSPAPSLSIAPGIGTVTGTSKVVSPIGTTTYTLTASNSAGTATSQAVVSILDTIAPSAPANLAATPISTSQVNLVWSNSIDNVGVIGYQVFRNGLALSTSPTNSYSDNGLAAGTTYTYTVAAFDAAGNTSTQSASSAATTPTQVFIPSLVQASSNIDDTFGTTISQPFASPTAVGNLVAVVISWGDSTATPVVTDNTGNTYIKAVSTYSSAADQSLAIYYAKNVQGGASSVTVNFGGSHAWRRILIAEYRGIDPVNPVDGVVANQGSATTATDNVTSGSIVATTNGDLIFGAIENYSVSGTVSAGTGFSLRSFVMDMGVIETAFEDRVAGAAGSTAATFTFARAASYIAQMVAFRPAAGQ
ncbi:MAG TPA: DUF4038 domain-containing protein [Patescibacteria group bacterium]|nr:DUF4038 domain-containing protein [Patescibacteria group bacterium]